jgi:protein-disulfide isomerase
MQYTFRPQNVAKRSEVFAFANNVINFKNTPIYTIPEMTGTLSTENMATLKKDAYIQGKNDATILVVEFADLECPFCKRMHDDEVIKHLEAKYGDQLAFSFQHFPLPFHELALPAAHTAECVAEQGGSDAFYTFIDKIFSKETPTQTNIDEVLSQMNLANETLRNCVKNLKYQIKIDAQMATGTTLGITGTPGTFIINTKTGNYEIVSGAQPEANFVDTVDRLLQ